VIATAKDSSTQARPLVAVLPTKFERGWPQTEEERTEKPAADIQYRADALTTAFPTDAHIPAYSVPAMPKRLKHGAEAAIPGGVRMVMCVVDVDGPMHRHRATIAKAIRAAEKAEGAKKAEALEIVAELKAKTPQVKIEHAAWWTIERGKIERLHTAGHGVVAFTTTGGYRLLGWLPHSYQITDKATAEEWSRRYLVFADYLRDEFGIEADRGCSDWQRLYRLPFVCRDGEQQAPEMIGDPANVGTWNLDGIDFTPPAVAPKLRAVEPVAESRFDAANAVPIRDVLGALGLLSGDEATCPGCRENCSSRRGSRESRAILDKANSFKCLHERCSHLGKPKGNFSPVDAVMARLGFDKMQAVEWLEKHFDLRRDDEEHAPRITHVRAHAAVEREPGEDDEEIDEEINTHSATAPGSRHDTDAGNAALFAEMHRDVLRYVVERDVWLKWTGARWCEATRGELRRAALATARRLLEDASRINDPDRRKAAVKWALNSEGVARQDAMITAASAVADLEARVAELDADSMLLTVKNGTIDLRTGQLRPHRREDLITRWTPIYYDAAAMAARWEKFLGEVFNSDENLIAFMRRAVGYMLTGSTSEHALLLLYGIGANGKSVLINVLRSLLGDFAEVASVDTFTSTKREAGAASPDLVKLAGARLVIAQESEAGARLAESTVKALTGGDAITARALYKDEFSYVPQFKLVIATNHRPRVRGTDDGIWRRLRLVPFSVSFLGREDRGLTSALQAELPGILAWAVRGCVEWQRDGLGMAEAVAEATSDYRSESDTIGAFIGDRLASGSDLRITRAEVFKQYADWCTAEGETPVSAPTLYRAIGERPGIKPTRNKTGRGFQGIGIRGDR
jgi:P4 family phage/plasmid primase-like protien